MKMWRKSLAAGRSESNDRASCSNLEWPSPSLRESLKAATRIYGPLSPRAASDPRSGKKKWPGVSRLGWSALSSFPATFFRLPARFEARWPGVTLPRRLEDSWNIHKVCLALPAPSNACPSMFHALRGRFDAFIRQLAKRLKVCDRKLIKPKVGP